MNKQRKKQSQILNWGVMKSKSWQVLESRKLQRGESRRSSETALYGGQTTS